MTPRFLTLFSWHVVRNVRRHRGLALLNILSIALGIAVYLAIQIANRSANRSFEAGVDLVAGKAHLEIRGQVNETLWPVVAAQPGVAAATALLEGVVTLPDFPGEYLRVVGVDLFTNEKFRTLELRSSTSNGAQPDLASWLATPAGIALSKEFAARHRLAVGARLRLLVNSQIKEATVLAMIDPGDSPVAVQPRFAVMDLGWAQELFGRQGRVSSIEVILAEPDRAAEQAEVLRRLLPPDVEVNPPRQRSFQMQHMLSAFQLNLGALSMVSLLVGTFLIYSTVSATVTRRRAEIGILRALGATRLEIRCLFLGEAALFGVLGVVLGTACGVGLAGLLAGAVAKTISSLYLLVSIDALRIGAGELISAVFLGMGAVLAGAWIPASEATRVDPVEALSPGAHAQSAVIHVNRWHRLALGALALGLVFSRAALHPGPPALSFMAAFFVLLAFALFAPGATLLFSAVGSRNGSIIWRLAAGNLRRSLHRTGITVGALAVALAMLTGLTVMIYSFRGSVNAWVNRGIVADLFVAPASNETIGLSAFIPAPAIAWLRARPDVSGADTFYEFPVSIGSERALVAVIEGKYREDMEFAGGQPGPKMARVFAGEAVAVTESYARKFGVREGSTITLATPLGRTNFEVAGIYSDYTRDQGVILMGRRLFARYWNETGVQSLAVYLKPGADGARLAEEFGREFSGGGELAIYSNKALRSRILSIFDQTFAVTYVLRTIAVIVALVGIFLTVSTLVTERAREIGVSRAIGASTAQIRAIFMAESAMIGALASLLGIAGGSVLAVILTAVVNPAFFGWSIALRIPWGSLVATPLWIIPAAAAAGWYPAWRAARASIARTVRDE